MTSFRLSVTIIIAITACLVGHPPKSEGHSDPKEASPAATVRAFYRFHFAHNMAFTRKGLNQRRGWLAPELYEMLMKELTQAEKATDEAPLIDGDPFTDSQEYPNSYRVGDEVLSDDNAEVKVVFTWKERGRTLRSRPVMVQLHKIGDRWRIANFKYEDGRDLVGDLKSAQ
jgi:hypothetical protein